MLYKLLSALGLAEPADADKADTPASKRQATRRRNDKCVGLIDGRTVPVLDWSTGGVRVFGDPRTIALGQEMDVVLKFQINQAIMNVAHRAKVVRKMRDTYALQFLPLTADVRQNFRHIIDNYNAMEFASSQA